jgi:hypothetical protein
MGGSVADAFINDEDTRRAAVSRVVDETRQNRTSRSFDGDAPRVAEAARL